MSVNKKRILVAAQSYPTLEGDVGLMYVHTRNLNYQAHGLNITMLNFSTKNDYVINNIRVIAENTYKKNPEKYDVLIVHAANLRNHYLFLNKYRNNFKRFIFFYHGHEVMKINKDYSIPYSYMKKGIVKKIGQDIYDNFKLYIWRKYLPKVIEKSYFVFVSKWMYDTFIKNIKLPFELLENKCSITYNSVGFEFETSVYNEDSIKEYDFVTIRSDLDNSKYAIDIVNRLAQNSPSCKFLIIGKGKYFEHNRIASNIEWKNTTMSHEEIIEILQKARYALMPTRTDAQGLMMCEMAAFGIPVVTSDIPVCHEVFDGFHNVSFINNKDKKLSLDIYKNKKSICLKDERYYSSNTVKNEIEIIRNLL